ncbi:MAG: exopolyphosphatase, partial [Planctomycetota bacterium]
MKEEELEERVFAAVDLGSNSFHMVVGKLQHGSFHMLDRLRERVRLAAGLDEKRRLSAEAKGRALACLERFGERLRELPKPRVHAVGTNTLRRARGAGNFLETAEKALGHPIEIISGKEEGRLVYLGVSHSLADKGGRRLVVDIGGGSTEVILGEQFQALSVDSFAMGCVSWTQRFFEQGKLRNEDWKRAVLAARSELRGAEDAYGPEAWMEAIGSSGTIREVETILHENGWSEHGITLAGLSKLKKALLDAGRLDKLSLPGLSSDRVPVIAGGLAILYAVFKSLQIEEMSTSAGALREGLLYQLLGRVRHEDVRDLTIRGFAARFGVDVRQAERVAATAQRFLRSANEDWEMDFDSSSQSLGWAALLHEVGMSVAHSGHHKHGAYLVAHADLAGFSRNEQALLSALLRNSRRKPSPEVFDTLPQKMQLKAKCLAILLRLSCTLHRSRRARTLQGAKIKLK